MKKLTFLHLASALTLTSVLGCSRDAPVREPEPVAETAPAKEDVAKPQSTAFIQVEESIRTSCNLPNDEEKAPKFDFDRADLRPRGQAILDSVATCLTQGAMKGETVTVIGHADPRGGDEYNRKLGRERAQAASDYLAAHAVEANRIRVESRGEEAATGTDEAGWGLDRRVEVRRGSVAP